MKTLLAAMESIYLAVKNFFVVTQWLRVLKIGISVTIAVMLIFVLAGSLVEAQSMFTISLIPEDSKEGSSAKISLSETKDFSNPTIALDAGGLEGMTNIAESWLPTGLDPSML